MPTTKPIVVRKLGVGGVNLCKAPLKMDDNEVVSAQNAEPYADRGRTGIRKRPALRPINTVATDPIQGVLSVELAQGGAGAPTPVAGYHPPGITSPGPGNPDGDDDWPDPGVDDAPPFTPPTDIPPGPVVLVAMGGNPPNSAWKYTQDDGVTWTKTAALTHDLADSVDVVVGKTVTIHIWNTDVVNGVFGRQELVPVQSNPLDSITVLSLTATFAALTMAGTDEFNIGDFPAGLTTLYEDLAMSNPASSNNIATISYGSGTDITPNNMLKFEIAGGTTTDLDVTIVLVVADSTEVTNDSGAASYPTIPFSYTRTVS
jgi:hypothetical protein